MVDVSAFLNFIIDFLCTLGVAGPTTGIVSVARYNPYFLGDLIYKQRSPYWNYIFPVSIITYV